MCRNSLFKIGPRKVTDRDGYPLWQRLTFSNPWENMPHTQRKQNMFKKKNKNPSV